MTQQSVAYLPSPLIDEPLDGWVARTASGLRTSSTRLLRHWGISPTANLLRDISPTMLATLVDSTGLGADELEHMTLARWDRLGLRPSTAKRGHGGGAWARGAGGRHCVDCLQERGGVFRLQWSLQWSFACVRHQTLLRPTTTCTHPENLRYGRTSGASARFAEHHPLLATQSTLDCYLANPKGSTLSILGNRPTWEVFSDLGALTRMVLASPVAEDPTQLLAALDARDSRDWVGLRPLLPRSTGSDSPAARLRAASEHPALIGLAAAVALEVLTQSSLDEAARQLWWASPAARLEAAHHARTRKFSWALTRALASDAPNQRRPRSVLLSRFDLARFDEHHRRLSPLDPAKIPSSCWPTVRLEGVEQDPRISAVSASAALAMVATGRRANGAFDRLGLGHLANRIESDWDKAFDATDDGDRNFADLLALQRTLVDGDVPIDYDRRRRIFPEPRTLGRRTESRICDAIGRRLTAPEARFVAWYVWELLTGSDVLVSERTVNTHLNGQLRYRAQRAVWREHPPDILHGLAETALRRNRVPEPLTWAPIKDQGAWVLPRDPTEERPLEARRRPAEVRGGSRSPAVQNLGYDFESAVAFAASSNTTARRHLARNMRRFFVVAHAGSLRAAAPHLGITGPTLSVQIRDLERSLAQSLFDRHAGRMVLRPEGRQLVEIIERQAPGLIADLVSSLRNAAP